MAVQAPATNLADLVAAGAPGTCYELSAGTYDFFDVEPKDFMTFVGTATDDVIVRGTSTTENAFHGVATGVTIGRMTFIGFQGSAGEKRQEQAPIRGTSAIWASDRGQMATEWLIEEVASLDNFASGLLLGDHFTVRSSRFEGNGVTGISASEVVGGLIENNYVAGNGAQRASGAEVNGAGMKFGVSGTPEHPLVVIGNEVHNNETIGIWCDLGCQGFQVVDNYVHDHPSRGIMYELSVNAVIEGNTVVDSNSWTNFAGDFNAGAITVGESANVVVDSNYIEGAEAGIIVRQTERPARPAENFLDSYDFFIQYETRDVTVSNNYVVDARSGGVSLGRTGAGLITEPDSIKFEGNVYGAEEEVQLWWLDGESRSLAEWRTEGRDVEPGPEVEPAEAALPDIAPTPALGEFTTLRLNAGGDELAGADGNLWDGDRFFVGGSPARHQAAGISGTDSADLYRAERYGMTAYRVPVANGRYLVTTHHAEVFEGCQLSGCRVFSVSVEGQAHVGELDIYGRVGGFTALQVSTEVLVEDGQLDIEFTPIVQEPQISGLTLTKLD